MPLQHSMREEQRPLLLKRAQTAAPKLTVESDDENEFDDEDGSRDRPRDGDPENQRLLPLFSAAHLGMYITRDESLNQFTHNIVRSNPCLSSTTYHSTARRQKSRNHSFVGSITYSSNIPIPHQTDTTRDQEWSIHKCYSLCLVGKLVTISKGWAIKSRYRGSE